jgi:hypothetical protein
MYCGEYRLECCRYAQRKTKYQSISCILRIYGKSAKYIYVDGTPTLA